jgi:RNA 2',3'-cyclic 3'-phosphodiesterase
MSRLFIGLPLSEGTKKSIESVLEKLEKKHWPVKWEEPDKWHVTIAFLGEVQDVQKVREVLKAQEQFVSFTLTFRGLGRFPEPGKRRTGARMHGRMQRTVYLPAGVDTPTPRVIWVGLKGEVQKLELLAKEIRQQLKTEGVGFDEKTFKPHLTLGRVKPEVSRGQALEMAKEIDKLWETDIAGEWTVERLVLYESAPAAEGSIYRIIHEVKLE